MFSELRVLLQLSRPWMPHSGTQWEQEAEPEGSPGPQIHLCWS